MPSERKPPDAYIRDVNASTLAYMQELHQENLDLRQELAGLHADRKRLEGEIFALRGELAQHSERGAELHAALGSTERTNDKLASHYALIERQNASLSALYVASYRMHATLELHELLTALLEVVINLVGSEEVGIYELSEGRLRRIAEHGLGENDRLLLPLEGLIGTAVHSGELVIASERPARLASLLDAGLSACVPLRLGERVLGAIVVWRLLGHKAGLSAVDREVFELLATHAATAFHCCRLHAEHKPAPVMTLSPSP